MMSYFLLRDNHESGPYTLADLRAKSLFATDLIWVEGESTSWKSPTEIPDLQGLPLAVKAAPPKKPRMRKTPPPVPAISSSDNATVSSSGDMFFASVPDSETDSPPSFEALKEKYARKPVPKKVWKPQMNLGANLMGLLTLLIGLGLSAYMVKKAVENIELEGPEIASAEAVAIEPENLPASSATHAAFASAVPLAEKRRLVPDSATTQPDVDAAFLGESKKAPVAAGPIDKTQKTVPVPKQAVAGKEANADSALNDVASANTSNAAVPGTPTGDESAEDKEAKSNDAGKPEVNDKADRLENKPSLRLSANKYNVGILGGISNLELQVSNPSAQEINKAVVEVEYLRPNGKVVGSQTITVSGIAPGGAKTVAVPDNSRGVSVRYKVIKIEG